MGTLQEAPGLKDPRWGGVGWGGLGCCDGVDWGGVGWYGMGWGGWLAHPCHAAIVQCCHATLQRPCGSSPGHAGPPATPLSASCHPFHGY